MSDSLRIDDNVVGLAALSVVDNIIDDILLVLVIFFRKKNILCAVGNAAPKCDIACISSHNLDDTAALMGR